MPAHLVTVKSPNSRVLYERWLVRKVAIATFAFMVVQDKITIHVYSVRACLVETDDAFVSRSKTFSPNKVEAE